MSAVCFKHKCFALLGTTDTPSKAVQDVAVCLCVFFGFFFFVFFTSSGGRPRVESHSRRLRCLLKESNTQPETRVSFERGMEQQVGLRSIQVCKPQPLRRVENMRYTISRLKVKVVT